TFTLTSAQSSQTANASGVATYQVNVNAANTFTGQVSFSTTGLPGGSSISMLPATVTGQGRTALTVTVPAVSTTTLYTLNVTGQSGSQSSSVPLYLTVNPAPNPAAPATITGPVNGTTLSSNSATFTWSAGAQVSQYNLLIGTTPGGSDY